MRALEKGRLRARLAENDDDLRRSQERSHQPSRRWQGFAAEVIDNDLATAIAGAESTSADIEKIRVQYGLDRPITTQFFDWLGAAARRKVSVRCLRSESTVRATKDASAPSAMDTGLKEWSSEPRGVDLVILPVSEVGEYWPLVRP